MKKEKNRVSVAERLLQLVFTGVLILSVFMLGRYFFQSEKTETEYDELRSMMEQAFLQEAPQSGAAPQPDSPPEIAAEGNVMASRGALVGNAVMLPGMAVLYQRNPDVYGWIKIQDTKVDYPVMYTPQDPEYYLRKTFDKKESKAGTPFIWKGSEETSDNTMIYGHHMKNGLMFTDLLKYRKKAFYEQHPVITFSTLYQTHEYKIIAAFETKDKAINEKEFRYYDKFNFADEQEFDDYLLHIKSLTPYDIPETAAFGDELITLSTCSYLSEGGRFVVVAKYSGN